MQTLVVVESPAKARKIEEILGKNYRVISSKGHILELLHGGNKGIGVDIDNKYRMHYGLMSDKHDFMNELLMEAKKAKTVLVASDADFEGEFIAWSIASRLEGISAPIKRVTFKEISKNAILKAIKNNIRDIDMKIVKSQEARRAVDRIVGFKVSPYLINMYNQKLSAGRVQSCATRIIIEKENEIDNFKPETYWNIDCRLNHNGKEFSCRVDKRITEEIEADKVVANLKSATFTVKSVSRTKEKKAAPPPLITSTLQQYMSRKHSISSDQCMKAAQSLYEMGFITYMRTDSVKAEADKVDNVRSHLKSNGMSIPIKENVYSNKDSAQDAHEAILPVDLSVPVGDPSIIDPNQKLVYEAVYNHFLASQMTPAIYDVLKVTIETSNKITLKVGGKALIDPGYLAVLGGGNTSEITLPDMNKGDLLSLVNNSVSKDKKQTQPPARYSEANLIKELDARGVGRPSTYSAILSKILDRNYVEKNGNVYKGTDLGKKINNNLCSFFDFLDLNYTKNMEEKLDLIATGKISHLDVLDEFYSKFKIQLDLAYKNSGLSLCDLCGNPMLTRTNKKDGSTFQGCSQFPKCRNIKK